MKIKDLINKVLNEGKEKDLFIFYKISVLLQNFPQEELPEQPVQQNVAPPVPPQPEQQQQPLPAMPLQQSTDLPNTKMLVEDIFKSAAEGKLTVTSEEADNIQTLEDLLDFMVQGTENGPKVMNEVVVEIIKTVTGAGTQAIADLVKKGDKVIIGIDYGTELEDSVGLKLNKLPGSDSISLSMKKNNKVIPGLFDIGEFNTMLIYYRNSLLGGD